MSYVHTMHDAATRLHEAAYRLQRLADGFSIVGNEKVSLTLRVEAASLHEEAEGLLRICGEILDEQLAAARRASSNLLQAALAGAILGNRPVPGPIQDSCDHPMDHPDEHGDRPRSENVE